MTTRVITAGSVSANYHVHIRNDEIRTPVSAGYDNEQTLFFANERHEIPIESRDVRITAAGSFDSVSGDTVLAVDVGPKGSAYVNLFSVSAPFTSAVPLQIDHVVRFRLAVGASVGGTSVDAWIG